MTDENGVFEFKTAAKDKQKLTISGITFETKIIEKDVSDLHDLKIKLRENVNSLDAVVISAGTFKAGDNSKVTTLKPLDVVTTASALGDAIAAFQTMPGTTTVAEDGRLFVRGGTANETQIFIDDIRVFTPYTATSNNTPTRGRYSSFLFDGLTFSTGGYAAEYGQALSSVLLMNTIDEPENEKTDISLMSVGGGVGNTQIWGENSLTISTSYINLKPYNTVFKSRDEWTKPYESLSGEAVYRRKFKKGLFKFYTAFETTNFDVIQEDINIKEGIRTKLENRNTYLNSSYKGKLQNKWFVFSGLSYTLAKNNIENTFQEVDNTENSINAKLRFQKKMNTRTQWRFGTEYFNTWFKEDLKFDNTPSLALSFKNPIGAVFTELDMYFSKKLALKVGVRGSYVGLTDRFNVMPRISLAHKISKNSQISLAYGDFYQNAPTDILKYQEDLSSQQAQHYIFNYQYNHQGKILRAELFFKQYQHLTQFDTQRPQLNSVYNASGFGYANGLDVFWRDNKSVKNLDYWLSYSWLNSQRKFNNYPTEATPSFVNKHNASLVAKYWLANWKSQIGLTYQFATGRTFTNPNQTGFLNQKTKAYHNLSLNWAYLISEQKILYLSVNNVLGTQNINGYQYSNSPNSNGVFERRALRPSLDRFFFVGFFWTLSKNKKDNQLNTL